MTDKKMTCPTCLGKKILEGSCECNSEWRGTGDDENVDDCQCAPDVPCPTCSGTGFINKS